MIDRILKTYGEVNSTVNRFVPEFLDWDVKPQHKQINRGTINDPPPKQSQIVIILTYQDPVVQSIVSLTISLRHKFVKQISVKVTNTLLFFVEKM